MANKTKNVVVIGGGVGGSLLAKSLQFDSNLVLIDPYDSLEFKLYFFLFDKLFDLMVRIMVGV